MKKALVRWIVVLVAVPLAVAALGTVAEQLEKRRGGDSRSARGVRAVRGVVRKVG